MADFRTELVNATASELKRFGGRKETDASVRDILIEYWTKGAGRSVAGAKKEIRDRTAWSAAFISLVRRIPSMPVRRSGTVLNNVSPPTFFGRPPTEAGAVQPKVGDLIGVTRSVRIDDFADALDAARRDDRYFSHFDVVTEVKGTSLKCAGGNVSNSVTEKTITLTKEKLLPKRPFKFDSAGQVLSGPFICVIQHAET